VSDETVRLRVTKFSAQYADTLRRRPAPSGRTWHLDEMGARVSGQFQWLWRTVDEHGQALDVLLQERRDAAAAVCFFRRLLGIADVAPTGSRRTSWGATPRRRHGCQRCGRSTTCRSAR
jgi:putative transposase